MKKILIQSDDYGMTFGITDGTIRSIQEGIVKNTGLFVNMDSSEYAAKRIKNVDVCLGIDINLVAGYPVSNLKEIPHLIREDGKFRSSRQLLTKNSVIKTNKYIYCFEHEPFIYDEVLIETENQVKRFIDLIGRKPEYMNSHSVITPVTEKALQTVARKYGIKTSSELYYDNRFIDIAYLANGQLSKVENENFVSDFIKQLSSMSKEDHVSFYVYHCGYVDRDLFNESSLTLQRMNDLACATDKRVIEFMNQQGIKSITYRDL